jgi:hypothetical protein
LPREGDQGSGFCYYCNSPVESLEGCTMAAPDYSRSRISFRPSVYSTGTQPVQPYTVRWPEGEGYGSWLDQAYKYTPAGYVYDKWVGEKEESAGGSCVDHGGLLGVKGAQVDCNRLAQKATFKGKGEGDFSLWDLVPDAMRVALPAALVEQESFDEAGSGEFCDADCQAREKRAAWVKTAATVILPLVAVVGGVVVFRRYRATGKVL